jgi:small-conductance mechanosensitive channel
MSKKKSSSSSLDEYELMPVKPLQDLQRELKQMRRELQKESSSEKMLIKLLNSNLQTQQKIIEQNYKLEEMKTHMRRFIEVIKDIEVDDEHNKDIDKLHMKLDDLHDKHDHLTKSFNKFNSRDVFSAFRRLPSGIPMRYKRKGVHK